MTDPGTAGRARRRTARARCRSAPRWRRAARPTGRAPWPRPPARSVRSPTRSAASSSPATRRTAPVTRPPWPTRSAGRTPRSPATRRSARGPGGRARPRPAHRRGPQRRRTAPAGPDRGRAGPDGSAEVTAFYEQCLTALTSLADAFPPHMDDQVLIQLARSVTLATGLDRLAAFQLDLVSRAVVRGRLRRASRSSSRSGPAANGRWSRPSATPAPAARATHRPPVTASTTAADIRQVLLDDRRGDAVLGVDPKAWSTAQTRRLAELWTMEQTLAAQLDHEAAALGVAARERAYLFAGGLGGCRVGHPGWRRSRWWCGSAGACARPGTRP